METVLLENCIKQYQMLLNAIKQYLISMYNDELHYDEIKRNLFTAVKMINTSEELMSVYNDENK